MNMVFLLNSILLGVGLAMDAFSVSLANGLNEPDMPAYRQQIIAGIFGLFQTAMPLIGWVLVHLAVSAFAQFEKFIPWIALILLLYIGGKMLIEGLKNQDGAEGIAPVSAGTLLVQAVATSIDALSVGFTIASYSFLPALVSTVIIGAVTYVICLIGLKLGRRFGTGLSGKASVLGGIILILIGIEIFIKGII